MFPMIIHPFYNKANRLKSKIVRIAVGIELLVLLQRVGEEQGFKESKTPRWLS
jgi:hypothetical protein